MKTDALKKLNCLLICLLAAGFVIAVACSFKAGAGLGERGFTGIENVLDGWRNLENDISAELLTLPLSQKTTMGKSITLKTHLHDRGISEGAFNVLHIKAARGAVVVTIGDRVVYSCPDMGRGLIDSATYTNHYLPIESKDYGEAINISLAPALGCDEIALYSAILTTNGDVLMRASTKSFWRSALGSIMLTVGLLLTLDYFVVLRYSNYPPMLWLGLFLSCYSVWNNAYIHTLMALSSNRRLCQLILYALFGLGGAAWIIFLFHVNKQRHVRLFNALITIILMSLAAALCACALWPPRPLYYFWISDAALIITGAVGLFVLSFDYCRFQDLCRPMAVGISGGIIGCAAGMLNAFFGSGKYIGLAFDLSLLFFSMCFMIGWVSNGINALVLESRIHSLELAAYRDQLTGCENRRAFDQKLESYRRRGGECPLTGLSIAMFDSNNLKIINDTYGHAWGDRVIISTAEALRRYLGSLGTVYRIGGDEFVVVCDNADRRAICSVLEAFDRESNNNNEDGLNVSWGVAYYKPGIDHNPESVLMRAEHRMYEYKKGCKL